MTDTTATLPRRDLRIIGLMGASHFSSHFFQLVLPPLFPAIRAEFGVSYTELGTVIAVMFAVSGIGQVIAGFLVDRIGAQVILPAGIALFAGAMLLAGLAPAFWVLFPIAALAGLGNSVYHPADYSVLSGRVTPTRLGRAYAVHNVTGSLGWAAAPVTMLLLAEAFGWRGALIVAGIAGLVFAAYVATQQSDMAVPAKPPRRSDAGPAAPVLFTRPVLLCLLYFTLLSIALVGMQNFLPTLLPLVQGVALPFAATATTAYLVAGAVGSMLGGIVADTTPHHARIIGVGLVSGGLALMAVGYVPMPAVAVLAAVVLAGVLIGATMPSRDMVAKAATPPGSEGKVFGFVYSGLDIGAMIAPPVIGLLVDWGRPREAFLFVAAALIATVLAAVFARPAR